MTLLDRWYVRYAIVLVTSVASLAFRLALEPVLGANIPYITFFPAVLICAWFGGLGPGLASVAAGGFTVFYFVVPPVYSLKGLTTVDVVGLGLFVSTGALTSFLTSGWREKARELRDSEARLRLAHRAAKSGIWDIDLTTRRLYWSDEVFPLYGFGPATEPSLEKWLSVVHPEDRGFAAAQLDPQSSGGDEVDFEFRIIRDGEVRWMMNLGQVTERRHGRPVRITGIARDITEAKRAQQERQDIQEAQRESEARLRFAIEAAHFGEWHLDLETKLLQGSTRFLEILGAPVPLNSFEDLLRYVQEEHREQVSQGLAEGLNAGRDWEFVVPITKPDGSSAWIWGKAGISRDSSGKPRYIAGLLSDITQRKRADEAVRESERIYRTMGETINYGVWICDPDGRNTYASESFLKLVGMTQQDCAAFGWGTVLHPEDRERTLAAWMKCVDSQGFWDIEHRYLGVDGRYHDILARGAPVRDDDGRTLCWAGINLDITSLRDAERERMRLVDSLEEKAAELTRKNRELEEFAYVVSHDLQEPLRTINIYTQLFLRKADLGRDGKFRDYTAFIQSGVHRMERLISDLLAFSRIVHADGEPAGQASVSAAFRQAEDALRPIIDETGSVITVEPLPVVLADESQLAQVFQNILSNAIKYRKVGEPARIHVSAEAEDGTCTIAVRDHGIGFHLDYSTRIFGLFKRLHRDEYPGTGLGLAICKRIVERYGGTIWAESAPGAGATFYFRLPAAEE